MHKEKKIPDIPSTGRSSMTTEHRCARCNGTDILQEVTTMVDPNDPPKVIDWDGVHWQDIYWCNDCDEQALVNEVKK
jgi:hypothetical protein